MKKWSTSWEDEDLWYNYRQKWQWSDIFLNYKEDKRWIPRARCGLVKADGSHEDEPPLSDYKAYGGKL